MPTDENVSRVKLRAPLIATFFSYFVVASTWTPALAGGAVTLDFSPLGEHAASTARTASAPADVNFGSYPLSVLGIDNAIRNAESRVDEYASGERQCDDGPIAYTVVAIRDWEKHYPNDPWIAKDLLELARFYARVRTSASRADERGVAEWLVHDYPTTAYASNANTMLADLGAPVPHADRAPVVAAKHNVYATSVVAKSRAVGSGATQSVAQKANVESAPVVRPAIAPAAEAPKPSTRATLPPYAHYESTRTGDANDGGSRERF